MTLEQIAAVGVIAAFGAFVVWGRTAGRSRLAQAAGERSAPAAAGGSRRPSRAAGRRRSSSGSARSARGGR